MTKRLCSPSYRQRLAIFTLGGVMLALYESIAFAADTLDPASRELLKFYAQIVIGLISVIGGLIAYIFTTGTKNLRDILQQDINGIGLKVGTLEKRIDHNEGAIETLQRALPNEYMRIKEHDRICPKETR